MSVDQAAPTYWHGGVTGLERGQRIVPLHRQDSQLAKFMVTTHGQIGYPGSARRVYVTTDQQFARAFAAMRPEGGALYRVKPRPKSSIEPDEDFAHIQPHMSFSAEWAVILEVVEPLVTMTPQESLRVMLPTQRWTDGSHTYDPDGWLLPSPEMRAHGVRPEQLRKYGQWQPPPMTADGNVQVEL